MQNKLIGGKLSNLVCYVKAANSEKQQWIMKVCMKYLGVFVNCDWCILQWSCQLEGFKYVKLNIA